MRHIDTAKLRIQNSLHFNTCSQVTQAHLLDSEIAFWEKRQSSRRRSDFPSEVLLDICMLKHTVVYFKHIVFKLYNIGLQKIKPTFKKNSQKTVFFFAF